MSHSCKWLDCGLLFAEEAHVYYHVVQAHSSSGKSVCCWISKGNICNVVFKHRNMLKDHAVAHFSQIVRPFNCDKCQETFRSTRAIRIHKRIVHDDVTSDQSTDRASISTEIDAPSESPILEQFDPNVLAPPIISNSLIPYCDIGSSYLKYYTILRNLSQANYNIPDSFSELFEPMKFNDSRIHPGVIHDIGLLDIEIKNLQLIQSNEKLRFKTDQERKKALSILVMTAFNSIHLPYPSNDVIAPSYHTHYRPLVTEILKHLLKYIETYCNEFKSTMLESYSFNFSPGCRLGLKLIYHPLLEKDAIKIRREHVRITAEILNEICNGFYTITSVLDKMYIKACYIKEIKEIIIWATIGPTIVLDRIPFPCENELFKEIAK